MTVYELIQELSKYPASANVGACVIGERMCPLNSYADGSVDIDECKDDLHINVFKAYNGTVRIEVELT